MARQTLPRQ